MVIIRTTVHTYVHCIFWNCHFQDHCFLHHPIGHTSSPAAGSSFVYCLFHVLIYLYSGHILIKCQDQAYVYYIFRFGKYLIEPNCIHKCQKNQRSPTHMRSSSSLQSHIQDIVQTSEGRPHCSPHHTSWRRNNIYTDLLKGTTTGMGSKVHLYGFLTNG